MAAGLKGLMAVARRAALKRGQEPTTLHLLAALVRHDAGVRTLLEQHGIREADVVGAAVDHDEPSHSLDLAYERALRVAQELQQAPAAAPHLLLALSREPRCAAYRTLGALSHNAGALSAAVASLGGARRGVRPLDVGSGVRSSAQGAQPRPAVRQRRPSTIVRRSARAQQAQQALAEEIEQKRIRARHAPVPGAECDEPVVASGEAAAQAGGPLSPPPDRPVEAPAVALELRLDSERFPLLTSLGRNLSEAAAAGQIDPVIGREAEVERVLDVLARRRANNPVLVGPPGVGKTAVVEGLALALVEQTDKPRSGQPILVELSAGALLSGTGVRGALSERMRRLRDEVADAGRVVIFLDEIHALLSPGEGADGVANELKSALARGELPCVGATTDLEYGRIFERDAALARRFTRIDIGEPSVEDTLAIVGGVAGEYEQHHGVDYDWPALRSAVELSVRYLTERRLPDKAIGLIDQAGARVRRLGGDRVGVEAVAAVVSELCGVPVERLLMRDGQALLAMEEHLRARIVGQDGAIGPIAQALRKSAAGFWGQRPLGTFLFTGPTGVGKTEMAKAISELMFPGSEMTRFDMSELSEPHSVARLLGAPPGYVGHEEGGQLTDSVRRRPYQLVLLDEVEKAHPDVLLALLPLLDEGRLTDGRGTTVDFTNTVLVLTSNLGSDPATVRAPIGFGGDRSAHRASSQREQRALAAVRAALPPELWNRIDEPLYFQPLGSMEVRGIARRMLDGVANTVLQRHGVQLCADDSVVDALIEAGGFDPGLGARPMRRTVGRLVEAPLAEALLAGRLDRGDTLGLRGRGAQVTVEINRVTDAAE